MDSEDEDSVFAELEELTLASEEDSLCEEAGAVDWEEDSGAAEDAGGLALEAGADEDAGGLALEAGAADDAGWVVRLHPQSSKPLKATSKDKWRICFIIIHSY